MDAPDKWSGAAVAAWEGWLSGDEAGHLRSLKSEATARTNISRRGRCAATLSRYAGCRSGGVEIPRARNGKPRIAGPKGFASLRFNLTHTKGAGDLPGDASGGSWRGCGGNFAQGGHRPGGQTFFFEDRAGVAGKVAAGAAKLRFFELWVLKEAYLKGRGDGLLGEPDQFTVKISDDRRTFAAGEMAIDAASSEPAACGGGGGAIKKAVPIKWIDAKELFEAGVAVE